MIGYVPLLLVLGATAVAPAGSGQQPVGPLLTEDPVLRGFIEDAMQRRPELKQARAQIAAERERVPQSKALPDPTLSVGIQNDGFSSIQVGKMETSFVAIMGSQTFPWAGKRGLRGEVVGLGTREAEEDLRRVILTITADVERAYIDLLLVRDQLLLLRRLELLWTQSEGFAQIRYASGDAPQSDLLRAQLQRNRLRQQRSVLDGEERQRVAVLNRLRGHPPTDPIATALTLGDLPDPPLPSPEVAIAAAEATSPELKKALLAEAQANRRVDLANRERWPDVTVNAGVMPRGGNFPTMWQAGIAINLPIWSAQKQSRAVAENQARGQATQSGAEAVRQLLQQRVRERQAVLAALLDSNRLFRSSVLAQSDATVSSTFAQYQVGRVTFASVLEALAGYVADVGGFLNSIAAAQRIAIAEREISLQAPGGGAAEGMGEAAMPGTGPASASAPSSRRAASEQGADSGGGAMSRM